MSGSQETKETGTENLREEIARLKEDGLRQMADFDNYRKQLEKEKQEYMKHASEKLILEILEVVDNFERALPQLKKRDPKHSEGIEMIYRQLQKVLADAGVRPIEARGKRFDPRLHEAFLRQDSDQPEGTITEEIQKGYMLYDKVIRHSKVKVAKNQKKEEEENASTN